MKQGSSQLPVAVNTDRFSGDRPRELPDQVDVFQWETGEFGLGSTLAGNTCQCALGRLSAACRGHVLSTTEMLLEVIQDHLYSCLGFQDWLSIYHSSQWTKRITKINLKPGAYPGIKGQHFRVRVMVAIDSQGHVLRNQDYQGCFVR